MYHQIRLEDSGDGIREWYDVGADLHSSQTAYLITGEENLLFDTMSPAGDKCILANLDKTLGDESLDYLVVSHPEANHAGNTGTLLREYQKLEYAGADTVHQPFHAQGATCWSTRRLGRRHRPDRPDPL